MAEDWQSSTFGQRPQEYRNVQMNVRRSFLPPPPNVVNFPQEGGAPVFQRFGPQIPAPHQNQLPQVMNPMGHVYDNNQQRMYYANYNAQVQNNPNMTAAYMNPMYRSMNMQQQAPTPGVGNVSGNGSTGAMNPSSAPMNSSANNGSVPPNVQQAPQLPVNTEHRPLNVSDALSYLDLVKMQFNHEPEIYNEFLDIMKEFKSQAIETPEVIARVSRLFCGYPNLIQGFNTFLPPGYRIEVNSADPNSNKPEMISIATPQGIITQSAPSKNARTSMSPGSLYSGNGPAPPNAPVAAVDPNAAAYPSLPKTSMPPHQPYYPPNAASNAYAAAYHPPKPSVNASAKQAADLDHAINFVNNVKNRFAHQPEVYNKFLEILQSYQNGSRPIRSVLQEITSLFANSPDLLEDFKRFLPDVSATEAASPAPPPMTDRMAAPMETAPREATPVSTTTSSALPPVGKFTPLSTTKQPASEKRRAETSVHTRSQTKRTRSAAANDANVFKAFSVPVSENKNPEELAFLEQARQEIVDEVRYNEFLKLLDLYSQEVFDRNALVERSEPFLGKNEALFNTFKQMLRWDPENCIPVPRPRVDLTKCKANGPSYRLLPKIELLLPCKGRDDLCWSVLNDAWVSHPTLASEDSGFIAHRKNQYEEALHKLEEERYEYDRHILANLRTIELLESHNLTMQKMAKSERSKWKLPDNLGGPSPSIYRKSIRKVYGKEKGDEVIKHLQEEPAITIGVVLQRLKAKDEEWRATQRKWNKVWNGIEAKNFLRSLDHQGIFFKTTDKRNTTTKFLIADLRNIAHQQKEEQEDPSPLAQPYHYDMPFNDLLVIVDAARLLGIYLESGSNHSAEDREKMSNFLRSFLSLFFDIPYASLVAVLPATFSDEASDSSVSTPASPSPLNPASAESSRPSSPKQRHQLNPTLLKDVLKRSYRSRETRSSRQNYAREKQSDAEDVNSEMEDDLDNYASGMFKSSETWVNCKFNGNENELDDGSKIRDRDEYNFFGNLAIYCFFRLFHTLYSRLEHIKRLEELASKKLHDVKPNPIAVELGLVHDPFERLGFAIPEADTVYERALLLCERIIESDIDQMGFEDALRCLYGIKAFQLYTVEKLVSSVVKQLHSITSNRRLAQVFIHFERDRLQKQTSVRQQIIYRKQAEAVLGQDETVCLIHWNAKSKSSAAHLLGREDLTAISFASEQQRWNYYVDSFIMSCPTEGISVDQIHVPFLRRNLPSESEEDEQIVTKCAHAVLPEFLSSELTLRITPNQYKLVYLANTEDVFARVSEKVFPTDYELIKKSRQDAWREWLNSDAGWKQSLSAAKIESLKDLTVSSIFSNASMGATKIEEKKEDLDQASSDMDEDEPIEDTASTEAVSEEEETKPDTTNETPQPSTKTERVAAAVVAESEEQNKSGSVDKQAVGDNGDDTANDPETETDVEIKEELDAAANEHVEAPLAEPVVEDMDADTSVKQDKSEESNASAAERDTTHSEVPVTTEEEKPEPERMETEVNAQPEEQMEDATITSTEPPADIPAASEAVASSVAASSMAATATSQEQTLENTNATAADVTPVTKDASVETETSTVDEQNGDTTEADVSMDQADLMSNA
ncbi:Clr6 histone deacetylase complex subunit Pst1 [Schizosaccharomyces japonicus yFS275]|uniref:Clr6 histone deacetylase complex subunit Pst1 n=1 Tax=Schizosaccharomyces japonicus (strain yFS275 / FY16936) TaxID=402676 RepID=B6K1C1_SCHJY|nr:Clr6 histone deacetylase complex subunit Pst1 [Schizosaccharomyces japonicus yFS275]EEB07742.1 Clr6 histone deacetylase complex subunit Pst1 [Schizosaccharomyces japonicus yFS275]